MDEHQQKVEKKKEIKKREREPTNLKEIVFVFGFIHLLCMMYPLGIYMYYIHHIGEHL